MLGFFFLTLMLLLCFQGQSLINFCFVRFRELQEGTLKDNGLMDESKIILIPNVETGLLVRILFFLLCQIESKLN